MIIEIKNNGIVDYPYIYTTDDKILVEVSSMKTLGINIALGYNYYDLITGKKLNTKQQLKNTQIIEIWNYDSDDISFNQNILEGEMMVKSGIIYCALANHTISELKNIEDEEEFLQKFNSLYKIVVDLDLFTEKSGIYQWILPTSNANTYSPNHKVIYNGKIYISTVSNNYFSPEDMRGWISLTNKN